MPGKLYLLPMTLGDTDPDWVIPRRVQQQILSLRLFFAENIKTTRRYLRKLDKTFDIEGSDFYVLNKQTDTIQISKMLHEVKKGSDAGIISEAGLPGIGDPGSQLVAEAHQTQIQIVPLTGPSSFVLALVASGLNGQSFAFHGYLPVKTTPLRKQLKALEQYSMKNCQTQIFMETPYRNNQLIEQILNVCAPDTKLCVAANISTKSEYIRTMAIKDWRNNTYNFHKQPAVFAILKN